MSLADLFSGRDFLNFVELRPPKGVILDPLLEIAERLVGRVDAVVVPDNPGSIMSMCPTVLCRRLVQSGQPAVLGLSCRDRNRVALQSLLLGAAADGVASVLVTRGADPSYGDHPASAAVHDLEPYMVLDALQGFREGTDMAGNPLLGQQPELLGGAEINPHLEAEALRRELAEAEQKVRTGARFLFTVPVHDTARSGAVLEPFGHLGVPIIARVVLLKSVGMARYLNRNVLGDNVPKATIKRLRKASDKGQESVRIAANMARELEGSCRGVCFVPLGWESRLPVLFDELG